MQLPARCLTRDQVLAEHFGLDCIKPLHCLFRFTKFLILSIHQDAADRMHHDVLDELFHHRDFPTFADFEFGHLPRCLGPRTALRCTNSFSNSDTSVLAFFLACPTLSTTYVDRFSATILIGNSVLPGACSFVTDSVLGCSRRSRYASHFAWR